MTRVRPYDPVANYCSPEEWERRMDVLREYEAAEAALEAGTSSPQQVMLMLKYASNLCEDESFYGEARACERALLILRQHYG